MIEYKNKQTYYICIYFGFVWVLLFTYSDLPRKNIKSFIVDDDDDDLLSTTERIQRRKKDYEIKSND